MRLSQTYESNWHETPCIKTVDLSCAHVADLRAGVLLCPECPHECVRVFTSEKARQAHRSRASDTELWREALSVTSNTQRGKVFGSRPMSIEHLQCRAQRCRRKMLDGPLPRPSAAVIAAADDHDRTAGLTKCRRALFPALHLNVGKSRKMPSPSTVKYSNVRLSHWDEHVELFAGVTQHHCFQLAHDACCSADRCGIWFEWVCFQVFYTSTLRYSETSLCLIPCLRPELIGAECCDIHAVFVPPSALDWRYTAALFPVDTWRVAPFLVAVEFGLQILHTSALRFSDTLLCSIACMRPELVCTECCDIHAVFVPLSATLVACRLRHLSSSVNSFTCAHRGGGALPMCNVSQLSLSFFPYFSLAA